MRDRLLIGVSLLVLVPALTLAEDWTGFRGAAGGVSGEDKLPSEWSAEKNIGWKVSVPGVAWSQPIIVGDKVFVTTAITDKQTKPAAGRGGFGGGGFGKGGGQAPNVKYRWEVHCLDRSTGKLVWKELAVEQRPTIPKHGTNTYATETPVSDGERIYAYFGMVGLFCYDLQGKLVWKKELGSYPMMAGWGTGSSPALDAERLFIQCDNEQKSFLVAFDKKTGKELWRVDRDSGSSWSSPYVWKNKKRTEVVTGGTSKIQSYDPATGKVLWEIAGPGGRASATPVGDDELLYVGKGGSRRGGFGRPRPNDDDDNMSGGGPLYAVRPGAEGDVTLKSGETANAGIAWSQAKGGPSTPSPVLYKGHVYVLGRGILSCYDAKTGKPAYERERVVGAGGFTSSPWAYADKVFCLDENGRTFVIKAGDKFEILGKNTLDEMFWSSAAVSGGSLFLRGVEHLYCIKP